MKKEKYDLKEQKKTQKLNPGPFYPKKKKLIIIWNLWTSFEVLIYRFERGISWGQDLLDHLFFFSGSTINSKNNLFCDGERGLNEHRITCYYDSNKQR